MPTTETRDWPVTVGERPEARTIYVTDETAAAIRADANRLADQTWREADGMWDGLDVQDVDALKTFQYRLRTISDAIQTLIQLAPLPDEEESDG